ncbi:MmpS family transport accessory protein [Cnuibacter physcomitrellae]|uniref:MmpS family transport accessory protein n=1 Tax=Cnuibacter physcomitrellae TaxID=1619308 RepID=UPI002175E43E|nr:MmpS family transport accessory protein [Cnuibacter physcomitrellae]MCS5496861.1 MmpS family transport accessory protein [Cnuibacter physcomitrellae]
MSEQPPTGQPYQPQPGYQQPQYQQPGAYPPPPQNRFNGLGLASLIIGGLSLLFAFVPFANYASGFFAFVGIILGIIGLVLKGRAKLLAIIGTAVSVIALILSIVLAVVYTAGFAASVSNTYEEIQASQSAEADVNVPVVYEVTGDVPGGANITYSTYTNGSSGTQSSNGAPLPFTQEFTVKAGDAFDYKSFYLSVSTGADPGTVTCRITVDGEVVSENTATGSFALATCSSSDFNGLD